MTSKPNILLFFVDDQRFDTINALGNKKIHTPHLDKLVSTGTSFTHAHNPGGTCAAVCMPSRAMLLTGRGLFHIEREGQSIPEAHTMLGECLKQEGYTTFGTGKWHNGKSSYARSFTEGDEIFFGGMGDHWNVPVYHFDPEGKYATQSPFIKEPMKTNAVEYQDCDHITVGKHSTELFVDAALKFLSKRKTENPFFMHVSLMAPHDPRTMPKQFLDMYDPSEVELPKSFCSGHAIDTGALKIRDELLAAFPRDPEEIKRHIAEYYAMITHLDDELGRLLQGLEDRHELENTIIVFSGDNGLAVGKHGLMGKQNLYDHSVRVPLLFAGPGIPKGEKTHSLAYLSDIFPTLCDMIKAEKPETVEGRSLLKSINNSEFKTHDQLYLVYGNSIRGLSDSKFKLIEYASGPTQLFDLLEDPEELINLAEQADKAIVLKDLKNRLIQERDKHDDLKHPTGEHFWKQRADLN